MKKIAFLLALIMIFLPAIASAYHEESEYVGTWIKEDYNERTGYYKIYTLKLTKDHYAYYFEIEYAPGQVRDVFWSSNLWKQRGMGIVINVGQTDETILAYIGDDGNLFFNPYSYSWDKTEMIFFRYIVPDVVEVEQE